MKARLKRIFNYFNKGQLRGIFYEKIFIHVIPEWYGLFWLNFYKFIYQGFEIGDNIRCWGKPVISKSPGSSIVVGNNVRIGSDFVRAGIALYSKCKIQAFADSRILIGNDVALSGTSITCRTTSIAIGNGTIIAPNCIIVDSDFHAPWPPENRTYSMGYERDSAVTINKNVWIGMNSIVLKGVTIGDNSIIAAGSVVNKSIPPDVIAGGNPVKVLKKLTEKEDNNDNL